MRRARSARLVASCAAVLALTSASAHAQFFGWPRAMPFPEGPVVLTTMRHTVRVVPFVTGLEDPWSLTFLPSGDILVTEKPGRLRLVRAGVLEPRPIAGVPEVATIGQGGLLEVALHPDFAENQLIYLTYAKPGAGGQTTALARARLDGVTLVDLRDIFVADNWRDSRDHFGSKLAFGPDGTLYMTVGERDERARAQDPSNHGGTILRLRDDGSVPPDNPFVGRDGFRRRSTRTATGIRRD